MLCHLIKNIGTTRFQIGTALPTFEHLIQITLAAVNISHQAYGMEIVGVILQDQLAQAILFLSNLIGQA